MVGSTAYFSGRVMVVEGTEASGGALTNPSDSAAGSYVGLDGIVKGRVQEEHRQSLKLTMSFHS